MLQVRCTEWAMALPHTRLAFQDNMHSLCDCLHLPAIEWYEAVHPSMLYMQMNSESAEQVVF